MRWHVLQWLQQEVRWDDWEERVEEHRRTRPPSQAARAASTIELCVPLNEQSLTGYDRTSTLDKGNAKQVKKHMEKYLIQCMPTIRPEPKDKNKQHREKLASREVPFNLMVARPVGRQEMTDCPEAQAAMQKEWTALREQKVWNLLIVREKSDVINEARRLGKEVQFGRVHGICVEKNRELPHGHLSRKFKGRVVFLGNQVKNQDFEQATFHGSG